jgi:pimeloyl-ACP methyl ester carboxylesterase
VSEEALARRSWKHWTEPDWVEVDGLATAYRRKGQGDPMLFLHGAGQTRYWLPLYERLSGSFDLIVPEHPGFGDTEMPSWLDSVDDLVLHYDALLEALGVEGAHLCGHSLGGWIAASLAYTYPRRFRSMSLVTPIGLRVPGAPIADPFRLDGERALEMLLSGAPAEKYMEYFTYEDELEDTIQGYSEAITFARLLWNPRYDLRLDRRLGRVKIPTLVIAAEEDRFIPRAHVDRWAELIPGATTTTVEGDPGEPTGHVLHIQQPDRLAAVIADHAGADPGRDL